MPTRRYDYEYIRRELDKDPELVRDLGPLVIAYNEAHEGELITRKALRSIVYHHFETWYGRPAPEGRRGRPALHDTELVIRLRKENPRASLKELVKLYNKQSQRKIPYNSFAIILSRNLPSP